LAKGDPEDAPDPDPIGFVPDGKLLVGGREANGEA
jgi:hypothetical protein